MEPVYDAFGATLRRMRRAAGVTQEQLAGRLQLNRTTVVNIEKGRQRVALHQIYDIADALGCEPAQLLPVAPIGDSSTSIDDADALFLAGVRAQKERRR
jgi:transcriptional regulator with XRE-family HTH domain